MRIPVRARRALRDDEAGLPRSKPARWVGGGDYRGPAGLRRPRMLGVALVGWPVGRLSWVASFLLKIRIILPDLDLDGVCVG